MYNLRKLILELSNIHGHGTELITVYIPKGKELFEIIKILKDEQGTACNIKSDFTRNNVLDSLTKINQRLKLYDKLPNRGLVIFCGVINNNVKIFEIDPPKDLKVFLYRCDDHFYLDNLKELLIDDNLIGFLALDTKDAGFGLLSGDNINSLYSTSSGVAGKHRQGGQSAKRFEKLREMNLIYYYRRIASKAKEYFIDKHKIKGLIIAGPGHTKEEFINKNYLDYRLQKMIISTLDISNAGSEGIRESFNKSIDILANFRIVEEKKLTEKLFLNINNNSGLGIYGLTDILKLVNNNIIDTLLVNDDLELCRIETICNNCKYSNVEIINLKEVIGHKVLLTKCVKCTSTDIDVIDEDIVDYFFNICSKTNTKIEVIHAKTEHGHMLDSLGKIGAILKYKINY